ncbi:MAG TPA: GyrI-like domain-containing protein [Anaerolineae bacterium]|nr:GyrI-like domain-containing protein [Anaerolineae bacterium]
MEPTIVAERPFLLVGLDFFGDPFALSGGWSEENEIGRLWKRFMAYLGANPQRLGHTTSDAVMYEVHVEHAETAQTGEREVFVGLEVDRLEDVPVELVVKILPAVPYAVFALRGQEILSDWHQTIYRDWLPGSGYEAPYNYAVERYDERFKGVQQIAESMLEVYIPIRRRAPGD